MIDSGWVGDTVGWDDSILWYQRLGGVGNDMNEVARCRDVKVSRCWGEVSKCRSFDVLGRDAEKVNFIKHCTPKLNIFLNKRSWKIARLRQ